jgi:hypothetical protein
MNKEIELKENTNYFYVETLRYLKDSRKIDISIFEENEWNHLLNISKTFEEKVMMSNNNIFQPQTQQVSENKGDIYFLYNCDFCRYN